RRPRPHSGRFARRRDHRSRIHPAPVRARRQARRTRTRPRPCVPACRRRRLRALFYRAAGDARFHRGPLSWARASIDAHRSDHRSPRTDCRRRARQAAVRVAVRVRSFRAMTAASPTLRFRVRVSAVPHFRHREAAADPTARCDAEERLRRHAGRLAGGRVHAARFCDRHSCFWARLMSAIDLTRIEEAGLNALQTQQQLFYDGWLLRVSPGSAKRARSVNPYFGSTLALDRKIAHCERLYAARDLPTLFRITPFAVPSELDEALAKHGYVVFQPTYV